MNCPTLTGSAATAARDSTRPLRDDANPPSYQPAERATLSLTGLGDFWRLWFVGLIIFTVRWLETVVVAVFVFGHTGSPFVVAATTMLRLLPMGLFGPFLGALAERIDRRMSLIGVVLLMWSTSLALASLAWTGQLAVWHLALASFLNGVAWATDNPVRRALIGEVVGARKMAAAMSLDVGGNNASRMVGPTAGGLLLASIGMSGVFLLSVSLYTVALVAAIGLRHRDALHVATASVISRVAEGLAVVRSDRRLIGTLIITMIYNLFGWPFTSMVPVIGASKLHLSAQGIGILASMDGVGAFLGAILLTLFVRPSWYGYAYLGGVVSYLVMLVAFTAIPQPLVAGLALVMTGLGGAGFSTMQATLVYLSSPPEMRSRILGVLSFCIGVGPLGFLGLGLLADWIGASAAAAASGSTGLLAILLTRRWWRHIFT